METALECVSRLESTAATTPDNIPRSASGFRKPLGKENQGFAVHHRPVPLAHDLEIRGTLAERRTGPPRKASAMRRCSGGFVTANAFRASSDASRKMKLAVPE